MIFAAEESSNVRNRSTPAQRLALLCAICLALAVWTAACPQANGPWLVPAEARARVNPVPVTDAGIAVARDVYLDSCSQCHGETGKGDGPQAGLYSVPPGDFTDARFVESMTDGELFYKISEGRRPMPSFKRRLTDEQRWQLVNLLRTFAPKPPAPRPAAPASSGAPVKKSRPTRKP